MQRWGPATQWWRPVRKQANSTVKPNASHNKSYRYTLNNIWMFDGTNRVEQKRACLLCDARLILPIIERRGTEKSLSITWLIKKYIFPLATVDSLILATNWIRLIPSELSIENTNLQFPTKCPITIIMSPTPNQIVWEAQSPRKSAKRKEIKLWFMQVKCVWNSVRGKLSSPRQIPFCQRFAVLCHLYDLWLCRFLSPVQCFMRKILTIFCSYKNLYRFYQ